MIRQWLLAAVSVVAVPGVAYSQGSEPVDSAAITGIRDEGLKRSQIMDLASWLTDVYGPRLTGSPGIRVASDWAVKTLTGWGLANARQDPWGTLSKGKGRGWSNNVTMARAIAPQPFQIYTNVTPWTPGTNGPARGDVVLLDSVTSMEQLQKFRGKLKGKFVFVTGPGQPSPHFNPDAGRFIQDTGPDQPMRLGVYGTPNGIESPPRIFGDTATIAFLKSEGVFAIISAAPGDDGTMFQGAFEGSPEPEGPEMPNVSFAVEHYGRIYRAVRKGIPVTIELNIENQFTDPAPSTNIFAEIPGTDPKLKDELVMFGAHFDSWHYGTGATDNGAGSVVMMEVMRILHTLKLPLKRTVRLALWSGEEQEYGSAHYVKKEFGGLGNTPPTAAHAKLSAYFNLDNGTGAIRGVYLQGNDSVAPIFRAWMEPFKDLGMTKLTPKNTGGTDHVVFDAAGIPGFQFIQDPIDYGTRTHHSNMDVYERLQADDLKKDAVIIAAFVYHAANRASRLPRKPPKSGS